MQVPTKIDIRQLQILQNLSNLSKLGKGEDLSPLLSTQANQKNTTSQSLLEDMPRGFGAKKIDGSPLLETMKNFLSLIQEGDHTKSTLFDIVKNTQTLKTTANLTQTLTSLLSELTKEKNHKFDLAPLKSLLLDITTLDEKQLKGTVEKLLFHPSIKEILEEISSQTPTNEIKHLTQKLTQQIEYYQLYSYLGDSFFTQLPFDWSEFEDGEIEFSHDKKKNYTCHLNLTLKEYGEIKITLFFDETTQMSLGFRIEHEEFKEKVSAHLPTLRKNFKTAGIELTNISLLDAKKPHNDQLEQFKSSYNSPFFEVKA